MSVSYCVVNVLCEVTKTNALATSKPFMMVISQNLLFFLLSNSPPHPLSREWSIRFPSTATNRNSYCTQRGRSWAIPPTSRQQRLHLKNSAFVVSYSRRHCCCSQFRWCSRTITPHTNQPAINCYIQATVLWCLPATFRLSVRPSKALSLPDQ